MTQEPEGVPPEVKAKATAFLVDRLGGHVAALAEDRGDGTWGQFSGRRSNFNALNPVQGGAVRDALLRGIGQATISAAPWASPGFPATPSTPRANPKASAPASSQPGTFRLA